MVAYIAGKISDNLDKYQYAFAECQMVLEQLGYTVLSPAWLPVGLHRYEDYMNISKQMLKAADDVFFLEGWKESKGARQEHEWAEKWHKNIFYYKKDLVIV